MPKVNRMKKVWIEIDYCETIVREVDKKFDTEQQVLRIIEKENIESNENIYWFDYLTPEEAFEEIDKVCANYYYNHYSNDESDEFSRYVMWEDIVKKAIKSA